MNQVLRENIGGYQVDVPNIKSCVSSIVDWVQQSGQSDACRWLACMNPHSYTESLKDDLFSESLRHADWLVPDGSGVVLASKILGGNIKERVTGSDIFRGLSAAMNANGGGRVFFLGSTEDTLNRIRSRMADDYPNLEVVGTYSPPFKQDYSESEMDEMVTAINSVCPDVLWVGMTAPKQEKWIYELSPRLQVKFAAAVGAVFDFYTGKVKRSHPIFQRLHLEWLPRLLQEPKRLWRRMAVSAPLFIWHVLRQRFRFNEKSTP
ncbi:WecB/TagA/CpsF family glycosyltransferase [Halioglobus sp. Uisw_031]|uniref:WecB/TagA/CpsF family glycosyltransferase n=1 Tax=Halioglobus sp. Uisw_031 TaxID=3230977 RepID=UPI0039EB99F1